jgi:hypothetical protein
MARNIARVKYKWYYRFYLTRKSQSSGSWTWLCHLLYTWTRHPRDVVAALCNGHLCPGSGLQQPHLRVVLKRTRSQITSNFYVSNWKSSYDVDNEMSRNVASEIQNDNFTVKLSFFIYFNASFFIFVRADRFQKPCSLIWDMMQ